MTPEPFQHSDPSLAEHCPLCNEQARQKYINRVRAEAAAGKTTERDRLIREVRPGTMLTITR